MDLFLGFESAAVENWKAMLPEIKAPSNYKKEEAIEGFIAKRMAELEKEVPKRALLGVTTRVVVLDEAGKSLFDGSAIDAYRQLSGTIISTGHDVRLFGFEIKRRIHQLAVTCAVRQAKAPSWGLYALSYLSTPRDLQQRISYVDPAKLLVGDAADYLSLLEKSLGLGYKLVFDGDAAKQAATVMHVADKCDVLQDLL